MNCAAEDCNNSASWIWRRADLLIVLCQPCAMDTSKELPLAEKMAVIPIRKRRL